MNVGQVKRRLQSAHQSKGPFPTHTWTTVTAGIQWYHRCSVRQSLEPSFTKVRQTRAKQANLPLGELQTITALSLLWLEIGEQSFTLPAWVPLMLHFHLDLSSWHRGVMALVDLKTTRAVKTTPIFATWQRCGGHKLLTWEMSSTTRRCQERSWPQRWIWPILTVLTVRSILVTRFQSVTDWLLVRVLLPMGKAVCTGPVLSNRLLLSCTILVEFGFNSNTAPVVACNSERLWGLR
jgi:hypothetical protein